MPTKHSLEMIKEKIISTVIVNDNGCWEWQGQKNNTGYGRFRVIGHNLAHRVSFSIFVGPLLGSTMLVCHKCDNPPCVNPEHLFIGTQKKNMEDCSLKGRSVNQNTFRTHCKRGHELTPENTKIQVRGRWCKICYAKNRKDADDRKALKKKNLK
jgi:hypothetical protein